jgi:DUF1680 family protein
MAKTLAFPVYLRIPAWAGPRTSLAVNGKRFITNPEPGQFVRMHRTWQSGDRIEVEFDMSTTLEAVDPQHPDLLAPVYGPLALFSIGPIPTKISKGELLAASQVSAGSTDWQAKTTNGNLTLRPFASIQNERYRLYLKTEA